MLQALVNWIWKAKRAPIIRKEQRTAAHRWVDTSNSIKKERTLFNIETRKSVANIDNFNGDPFWSAHSNDPWLSEYDRYAHESDARRAVERLHKLNTVSEEDRKNL